MVTHWLNFFIVTKQISNRHHSASESFCINSTGGSFCWNYATFYGNYAGDNICIIYAGLEVLLFVTGMLEDLSVAIKQVTVSVALVQLALKPKLGAGQ